MVEDSLEEVDTVATDAPTREAIFGAVDAGVVKGVRDGANRSGERGVWAVFFCSVGSSSHPLSTFPNHRTSRSPLNVGLDTIPKCVAFYGVWF
jgi:hypothetical protein